MITNKQKLILCILSIVALFIAVMAILPFSIIVSRFGLTIENGNIIELILKLIIFPIGIIGVSIYPIILRRRNYYEQLDVSVATSKMSFAPFAMYVSAIFGWIGGIIYASVSYSETKYLVLISLLWSISVVILFVFGIFTKFLHKLTGKQMLLTNILVAILFIGGLVACFFIYKSLPEIGKIRENNAFLMMLLYVSMFMISILFIWKSIFTDETTFVVLEKDESFTEEEVEEIIAADIDATIQQDFEEYYINNRGVYIQKLKAMENKKDIDVEENNYEK